MLFKDTFVVLICALSALLFSGADHLSNSGRRFYEEQFCDFFFNLDQWFRMRFRLKIFYLELCRPLCSVERNHLCNFGKGRY